MKLRNLTYRIEEDECTDRDAQELARRVMPDNGILEWREAGYSSPLECAEVLCSDGDRALQERAAQYLVEWCDYDDPLEPLVEVRAIEPGDSTGRRGPLLFRGGETAAAVYVAETECAYDYQYGVVRVRDDGALDWGDGWEAETEEGAVCRREGDDR